jgi:hypothetical protein
MSLESIEQAARWDFRIQQGSSWVRTMVFSVDISGMSFRGQIRRSHEDATVLATLAFTKLDAHTVSVHLTPAVTTALPATEDGEYWVHDIEAHTALDEFVMRVLEGRVTVTPEVTR